MRWIIRLSLLLLLTGCRSWGPPSKATLATIAGLPAAPSRPSRARVRVTMESDTLRGTFGALMVIDPQGPKVRLQIFPDIGPKLLDLVATPRRFAGHIGDRDRIDTSPDDAPRHLLVFMAFTLLEMAAPLTADRIEEARDAPGTLRIRPVAGPLEIQARVEGSRIRRSFRFRHVRWDASVSTGAGEGVEESRVRASIGAKGFSMTIEHGPLQPARLKPKVFAP